MAIRTGLEGKPWYFGAIVGVVLGGLIYFGANRLLLTPKVERIDSLETELTGLRTKIQEGLAAQRQLPKFREEVRALEFRLDKLLRILPARRNTPELMRRVRLLTEQGDFELLRFTPQRYADKDFYSEWPIEIKLDGGYHNLALLFDQISRFSRIINIEDLKIDARRGTGEVHSISASFTAKTFVYKEDEGSPESGGE